MDKNTEIKFVGQPIFSQVLKLIDKVGFNRIVKEKASDHYYKAFKSWTQTVTLLFGILSRCDSMTEICEGLRAMSGKLNHFAGPQVLVGQRRVVATRKIFVGGQHCKGFGGGGAGAAAGHFGLGRSHGGKAQ